MHGVAYSTYLCVVTGQPIMQHLVVLPFVARSSCLKLLTQLRVPLLLLVRRYHGVGLDPGTGSSV